MDTKNQHIGPTVKELDNLIKRKIFCITTSDKNLKPTMMQGWIIGYLCKNNGKEIFQRRTEVPVEVSGDY